MPLRTFGPDRLRRVRAGYRHAAKWALWYGAIFDGANGRPSGPFGVPRVTGFCGVVTPAGRL